IVGLVMAGLVAAVMSHISGAVNSCTTIATMDFFIPYIRKNATDRQAVLFGKAIGAVIVVLGIVWARVLLSHSDRPVFIYLLNAYGYITPGIAAMFLLGIFWERATHAGALAAGLLSIPLSAAIELSIPKMHFLRDIALAGTNLQELLLPFMNRTGVVFWVCIAIGILISLVTRPKSDKELKGLIWNRDSLQLPEAFRHRMRGLRNPAIWWAIVTAAVLFFYIKYH
ncbi:MAG: sodium:solute symporter family transporter, partial [Armatimonadota bacterium]